MAFRAGRCGARRDRCLRKTADRCGHRAELGFRRTGRGKQSRREVGRHGGQIPNGARGTELRRRMVGPRASDPYLRIGRGPGVCAPCSDRDPEPKRCDRRQPQPPSPGSRCRVRLPGQRGQRNLSRHAPLSGLDAEAGRREGRPIVHRGIEGRRETARPCGDRPLARHTTCCAEVRQHGVRSTGTSCARPASSRLGLFRS